MTLRQTRYPDWVTSWARARATNSKPFPWTACRFPLCMEAASLHSPASTAAGTIRSGPFQNRRLEIQCSKTPLRQQPWSCRAPANRGACPGEPSSSAPRLRTPPRMACWTCGRNLYLPKTRVGLDTVMRRSTRASAIKEILRGWISLEQNRANRMCSFNSITCAAG